MVVEFKMLAVVEDNPREIKLHIFLRTLLLCKNTLWARFGAVGLVRS